MAWHTTQHHIHTWPNTLQPVAARLEQRHHPHPSGHAGASCRLLLLLVSPSLKFRPSQTGWCQVRSPTFCSQVVQSHHAVWVDSTSEVTSFCCLFDDNAQWHVVAACDLLEDVGIMDTGGQVITHLHAFMMGRDRYTQGR